MYFSSGSRMTLMDLNDNCLREWRYELIKYQLLSRGSARGFVSWLYAFV
jgi:hypothetical protein